MNEYEEREASNVQRIEELENELQNISDSKTYVVNEYEKILSQLTSECTQIQDKNETLKAKLLHKEAEINSRDQIIKEKNGKIEETESRLNQQKQIVNTLKADLEFQKKLNGQLQMTIE